MKFLKNKFNPKLLFSTIGTALLVFIGSTQYTHADLFSISDVASSVFSGAIFSITYTIAFVFGVLIAIEAWFIGIILTINASILQTTLVQTGFSISLSIANLLFVLGIIVIALATILRNQTYGIKQLLWKLVVMAILVNFGLVIMSPIFAVGNSFTQYFLNCINPGAGSCSTSSGTNFQNFGNTFAGAFNPNNPWVAPVVGGNATPTNNVNNVGGYPISATGGAAVGQSATSLMGIVFVAVDLALIVIVLGGFIALLTVRYLYIAILAIVLPFAWASWVFPSFSSHWKNWWNQFIRWTFFAPIVVFFIYLALLTMKTVGAAGSGVFGINSYTTGNSSWGPISTFLGTLIAPVISSFVQEILLAGLIIGGMIAANSMGIKMAGTMVDYAQKQGKTLGNFVRKRGKQIAGDRARSAGRKYNPSTKETTTAIQRLGSKLQGVPGLRGVGSRAANWSAPNTVKEDSKEEIKGYIDKNLKNLTNAGLKSRATSATKFVNPMVAAAVAQELAKRDMTSDVDIAPLMPQYIEYAEKMGTAEAVFNNRPDLMPPREKSPGVFETKQETMARAVSSTKNEVINVNAQAFHVTDLADAQAKLGPHVTQAMLNRAALALTPAQLGTLGSDTSSGSSDRQKNITDGIRMLAAPFRSAAPNPATGLYELDKTALAAAATALHQPELMNLEKIVNHMKSNPNWVNVFN